MHCDTARLAGFVLFAALAGLGCDGETLISQQGQSPVEAGTVSGTADGGAGPGGLCGDGTRDGTEVCDGADLGGKTCMDLGFGGGTLACLSDCVGFDTSACVVENPDSCEGEECEPESCEGEECEPESCEGEECEPESCEGDDCEPGAELPTTPCNIGDEVGISCPSAARCSSGEWVEGCCIAGDCLSE